VSYLLSLPGALFVLLARRDDPFAVYHARQSLALAIIGIAAPLVWAIVAWLLAWIPTLGAMLGVILFALLIATYVGILFSWIVGMVYSLKGKVRPLPLFGTRSTPRAIAEPAAADSTAELIERTTISDA
jgi:uncharacterized membrane protein